MRHLICLHIVWRLIRHLHPCYLNYPLFMLRWISLKSGRFTPKAVDHAPDNFTYRMALATVSRGQIRHIFGCQCRIRNPDSEISGQDGPKLLPCRIA